MMRMTEKAPCDAPSAPRSATLCRTPSLFVCASRHPKLCLPEIDVMCFACTISSSSRGDGNPQTSRTNTRPCLCERSVARSAAALLFSPRSAYYCVCPTNRRASPGVHHCCSYRRAHAYYAGAAGYCCGGKEGTSRWSIIYSFVLAYDVKLRPCLCLPIRLTVGPPTHHATAGRSLHIPHLPSTLAHCLLIIKRAPVSLLAHRHSVSDTTTLHLANSLLAR